MSFRAVRSIFFGTSLILKRKGRKGRAAIFSLAWNQCSFLPQGKSVSDFSAPVRGFADACGDCLNLLTFSSLFATEFQYVCFEIWLKSQTNNGLLLRNSCSETEINHLLF